MQFSRTLISASLLVFSLSSSATTLNFNELVAGSRIGATYMSDGYVLSGQSQPSSANPSDQFYVVNDTGSPALIWGRVSAPIDFRSQTGDLFNAISIDIARGDGNRGLIPVTFTGSKASGVKVTASYWFPDSVSGRYQTFSFGGDFVNLIALTWSQGAEFHQFDNINVAPTRSLPEPSTIVLLTTCIAGFVFRSFSKNGMARQRM